MSSTRFQIFGSSVPSMLGRSNIMQRLMNDLTKPTPSHLSVIGPRFSGKSVLLNELSKCIMGNGSCYRAVVLWDLGHQTPDSDESFIAQISGRIQIALKEYDSNYYSEYVEILESKKWGDLKEVVSALNDDNFKILFIWDGFDKPLGSGKLTRNLWDNLRELASFPNLRLVTATRRTLRELIRNEESNASDFWNIFDPNPVRVGAFEECDRDTIIELMMDHNFEAGAKTELYNWSAGLPPLFLGILNQVELSIPRGVINNEKINNTAKESLDSFSDVIAEMWQDCPAGAKDLYINLVERREIPIADTVREERNCLTEKGFASQSGNKLIPSCRLLQEHIKSESIDTGSMARLFGSWEEYKNNIGGLLERRFSHIPRFDNRFSRLVERAIEDIPDSPDDCLNNLTGIRECALRLIWQREFGPRLRVPQDVIDYWVGSPRAENFFVVEMKENYSWVVPNDALKQIRLLEFLTGSRQYFESRAKAVSKDTYALINAIHSFRNRTQHPDGQAMHLGVAVAAIMTCLELLACLEREIGR